MFKTVKISKLVINAIFILLCLVVMVPFMIIVFSSLESKTGFLKNGYVIFPKEIDFSAYMHVFRNPHRLLDSYGTTIAVTAIGTAFSMVLMTTFAYVISRRDYPYKNILSFFLYFTMLFSGGMIGSYIWIAKYLRLTNTIWALILPMMVSPFNVFVLRNSCKEIPFSLVESAKMEGASETWVFIKIIIPLAKTGIATVALLQIFAYWNSWFQSMLYINDGSYITLQYYLMEMLSSVKYELENARNTATVSVSEEALRMALCTLAIVPMLFVFSFLQKYFVKGLTVGSVKG